MCTHRHFLTPDCDWLVGILGLHYLLSCVELSCFVAERWSRYNNVSLTKSSSFANITHIPVNMTQMYQQFIIY